MQSFTAKQKAELLSNPNVVKITENHLNFTPEFMILAVELYYDGLEAEEIFEVNGFNTKYFEKDYLRLSLKRWKLKYEVRGKESFFTESRGSGATGRPKTNLDELTVDELKAIIFIQGELLEEVKKKKALAKKISSK